MAIFTVVTHIIYAFLTFTSFHTILQAPLLIANFTMQVIGWFVTRGFAVTAHPGPSMPVPVSRATPNNITIVRFPPISAAIVFTARVAFTICIVIGFVKAGKAKRAVAILAR